MGKKRTYADTEDTGVFNDTEPGAEEAAEAAKAKGNNKYRRDKPWDHDGIDHWCVATDPTSTTQALRADHLLSPHHR